MKIKYLAIALLSTSLLSSPLFANDKRIDKSSPLIAKSQTPTDEVEDTNDKVDPVLMRKRIDQATPQIASTDETDVASTKERKFGTTISTEGQAHRATVADGGDSEELQSSKGYIKIDDIKGDSTKSSSAIPPSISGLEVTAPTQSAISDDSNDNGCDDDNDGFCGSITAVNGDGDSNNEATVSSSKKGYDYYVASSASSAAAAPGASDDESSNNEDNGPAALNFNTSRASKSRVADTTTNDENVGDKVCGELKKNEQCTDGHVTVLK